MKKVFFCFMILISISAQAESILDYPWFRVNVLTGLGEEYDSSTQNGRDAIKKYIGSLAPAQRTKSLMILNFNFYAIQDENVKTAFANMNTFCARDASITEVRISFKSGCEEDDISYNIRIIGGRKTGASPCDNVYDMTGDVSSGKYGYECMGQYIYNNENTKNWFVYTTHLIIKRAQEKKESMQNVEDILNGSN